jgi:signal-transduction protein with cAMP-binding, CBS, and nucleotidyltransferase domain
MKGMAMNSIQAHMLLRETRLTYRDGTTSDHWARVLETFALFAGVSRRRLRRLARSASIDSFSAGEIVLAHDEPNEWLYVILGGTAKEHDQSGTLILGIGDAFGPDVFRPGLSASGLVVAAEELHLMRLPRQALRLHGYQGAARNFAGLHAARGGFRALRARTGACST